LEIIEVELCVEKKSSDKTCHTGVLSEMTTTNISPEGKY